MLPTPHSVHCKSRTPILLMRTILNYYGSTHTASSNAPHSTEKGVPSVLFLKPAIEPGQLRNMLKFTTKRPGPRRSPQAPASWWVIEVASRNIPAVETTFDTSHDERLTLNEVAPRNIACIYFTLYMSQRDMSSLNEALRAKRPL